MKIIIDTNVMISAIFFGGKPLKILEGWSSKVYSLVISHEILTEYFEVAQRLNSKYPSVNAKPILSTIASNAEISFSVAFP